MKFRKAKIEIAEDLEEAIEFAQESGEIELEEAVKLRNQISTFTRKLFWADVFLTTIADNIIGWALTVLSAAIAARGHLLISSAIVFSPLSFQGVLRSPYIVWRIRNELKFLANSPGHKHKINDYRRYFKWLFVINFLRFPPLPIPLQMDNFAGPLLTLPRGGKLSSVYMNYQIHNTRNLPRRFKGPMRSMLAWVINKLP